MEVVALLENYDITLTFAYNGGAVEDDSVLEEHPAFLQESDEEEGSADGDEDEEEEEEEFREELFNESHLQPVTPNSKISKIMLSLFYLR